MSGLVVVEQGEAVVFPQFDDGVAGVGEVQDVDDGVRAVLVVDYQGLSVHASSPLLVPLLLISI